ncbi:MAG: peptide-methionine (R)-S-oxide reductase MsrB [Myxococcaceae bacterium]
MKTLDMDPKHFAVEHTDDEWRKQLSPAAYTVLPQHGTERAFTSALNQEKRRGKFLCAGCGEALFSSSDKFDSGTGWPSFTAPLPGAVETDTDDTHGMVRTEVHCARCGSHLGHVFEDGPRPTGERFCMNGVALQFRPESDG